MVFRNADEKSDRLKVGVQMSAFLKKRTAQPLAELPSGYSFKFLGILDRLEVKLR